MDLVPDVVGDLPQPTEAAWTAWTAPRTATARVGTEIMVP